MLDASSSTCAGDTAQLQGMSSPHSSERCLSDSSAPQSLGYTLCHFNCIVCLGGLCSCVSEPLIIAANKPHKTKSMDNLMLPSCPPPFLDLAQFPTTGGCKSPPVPMPCAHTRYPLTRLQCRHSRPLLWSTLRDPDLLPTMPTQRLGLQRFLRP